MINFRAPAQVVKVLALAAFIVAAIQMTASAEEWKDCALYNYTDRTVTQVYLCAADVDINEYGKNILEGLPPLKNGEGIPIQYPAEHRYYTLRAVFDNGEFADWENIDCNDMQRITLFKDGELYRVQIH